MVPYPGITLHPSSLSQEIPLLHKCISPERCPIPPSQALGVPTTVHLPQGPSSTHSWESGKGSHGALAPNSERRGVWRFPAPDQQFMRLRLRGTSQSFFSDMKQAAFSLQDALSNRTAMSRLRNPVNPVLAGYITCYPYTTPRTPAFCSVFSTDLYIYEMVLFCFYCCCCFREGFFM